MKATDAQRNKQNCTVGEVSRGMGEMNPIENTIMELKNDALDG